MAAILSKFTVLYLSSCMNAQIGKVENKFCSHDSSNRYGEHQTDFSLENRLTCLYSRKVGDNYGPTTSQRMRKHKQEL